MKFRFHDEDGKLVAERDLPGEQTYHRFAVKVGEVYQAFERVYVDHVRGEAHYRRIT